MRRLLALVLILTVCLTACAETEPNSVYLTLDSSVEVTRDELLSCILPLKEEADSGDKSYWENNPDEGGAVIARAVSVFITRRAVALVAAEYSLTLDAKDIAAVNDKIAEYEQQYGDNFDSVLAEGYMTRESYRAYLLAVAQEQKLYDALEQQGVTAAQTAAKILETAASVNVEYADVLLDKDITDFIWPY